MTDSDEEIYITQNSFISPEIAESHVTSGDDVDVEDRFDRLLNDAEIEDEFGNLFLQLPVIKTNRR